MGGLFVLLIAASVVFIMVSEVYIALIMNTAQLKDFCNQLPGVSTYEYGHPANILVYFVGDKRFAYFKTSEPEQWRFSIRVTPPLTDVPGIKPARYFARFHWVSIVN